MAKILVTGGAGFIGYHLCEALLEKGDEVTAVDNLITGSLSNIETLRKKSNFTFIQNNICNELDFDTSFDEIYNLASPASPEGYGNYPLETLRVNSGGVWNMLELAAKYGAKFLQTSTSEVYGDPLVHPQKEEYWGNVNPIGPRSCYDEGKRFAEALIVNFRKIKSVNGKIVRIFNTYGPRMRPDDGRVICNFITQALRGQDITVYGEGKQTRSFCFISDLVLGLMKMMASEEMGPINLGNPSEITIIELAKSVKKLIPGPGGIVKLPLPKDDPTRRRPDISLAKGRLGWEPKVSLEEGLRKTIEWFKKEVTS